MSGVPQMAYDENSPKRSVAGKAVIPVPGGQKLLSNVEDTGRLLIESAETVRDLGDLISRDVLIEMIEGHAKIGEAMVKTVERTRTEIKI